MASKSSLALQNLQRLAETSGPFVWAFPCAPVETVPRSLFALAASLAEEMQRDRNEWKQLAQLAAEKVQMWRERAQQRDAEQQQMRVEIERLSALVSSRDTTIEMLREGAEEKHDLYVGAERLARTALNTIRSTTSESHVHAIADLGVAMLDTTGAPIGSSVFSLRDGENPSCGETSANSKAP